MWGDNLRARRWLELRTRRQVAPGKERLLVRNIPDPTQPNAQFCKETPNLRVMSLREAHPSTLKNFAWQVKDGFQPEHFQPEDYKREDPEIFLLRLWRCEQNCGGGLDYPPSPKPRGFAQPRPDCHYLWLWSSTQFSHQIVVAAGGVLRSTFGYGCLYPVRNEDDYIVGNFFLMEGLHDRGLERVMLDYLIEQCCAAQRKKNRTGSKPIREEITIFFYCSNPVFAKWLLASGWSQGCSRPPMDPVHGPLQEFFLKVRVCPDR